MENLNTNEDIKRIRENSEWDRKNKEAAGVIQLILLPLTIFIIYTALKGLL